MLSSYEVLKIYLLNESVNAFINLLFMSFGIATFFPYTLLFSIFIIIFESTILWAS